MSKRGAPYCVLPPILILVVVVVVLSSSSYVSGQAPQENASEALLRFKTALANSDPALQDWNPGTPPCTGNTGNWNGVLCYNGYVWGLQLENMGLQGQIDVDALVGLPFLRTLSVMNNNFQGSMPDWRKLPGLKSLYLSGNQFSGQIPDDAFAGMPLLKKVHLSGNKFTGPIPASLTSAKLVDLALDNNQFTGGIPAVDTQNLKVFNVSNNQLEGPVPPSMQNMDPSSFSGNKALCGGPGGSSCDPPKPPPDMEPILHAPPNSDAPPAVAADMPKPKKSPLISPAKIIIIALSVLLALFLLLLLLILCWWSLDDEDEDEMQKQEGVRADTTSPYNEMRPLPAGVIGGIGTRGGGSGQQQPSKLSFVKEDRQKFDLQDLMRASAEMLGHGSFGASYKAVLVDGEALVVKRFKQMNNIAKEDFHDHMKRLGLLKHPNLMPLVAYLYRKEEKLLVFDFMSNNSLAKNLHDDGWNTVSIDYLGKSPEQSKKVLNWPCRLKIMKGVVRGLAYLYAEFPSLNVPHGHLKSSNVLIGSNYNALLMDYTLGPVVNPAQIDHALVAYKCPEYAQSGQTSKKSDVWCLGILILETMTGKPVDKYLVQGSPHYGPELAGWVNGMVAEASTKGKHVFDRAMDSNSERSRIEMEKLLQIGIACCREDVDKRLSLEEALTKIEQLQE